MFDVNGNTLQAAYSLLHTLEGIIVPPEKKATTEATIATLKREIRAYTNRPASDSRIVKDFGIDGYIELYRFPDELKDVDFEEAVAWFDDCKWLHGGDGPYDCTGEKFTEWRYIFRRGGNWFAYHSIGVDV